MQFLIFVTFFCFCTVAAAEDVVFTEKEDLSSLQDQPPARAPQSEADGIERELRKYLAQKILRTIPRSESGSKQRRDLR